jgi:hypothetical protein
MVEEMYGPDPKADPRRPRRRQKDDNGADA